MNLKSKNALINIFLADDDIDDCLFFKEALEELPLLTKLTAVYDGEQLMKLLINETTELPHILFLDLNMPRKNGLECLSEIKQNEKLKDVPVIIYSTSFDQDVVNKLYKNGVQYFIRKPSEFSQFKKIIAQTLILTIQDPPDGKSGNISQPTKENFVLTVQENEVV